MKNFAGLPQAPSASSNELRSAKWVPKSTPAHILTERRCCTQQLSPTSVQGVKHRGSNSSTLIAAVKLSLVTADNLHYFSSQLRKMAKHRLLFSVANGYTDMLFAVFCTHQFKAAGVFSSLLTLEVVLFLPRTQDNCC